jgi:poly(A) polymerase
MINIFSKIFNNKSVKNCYFIDFENLNKKTNIEKIFHLISNFSETSEIRYVGGSIRKIINKEKVDDIDLATNLAPKTVCEILRKNNISFYESGIEHGTITAKIDDYKFEITTLRKDISTDGRRAEVEFSNDWHEDASRRDFTFNAIYADLSGNLYDPFNGKKDLELGNVNFIGDPEKRIKEDYLRILRYVRFFLNYSKVDHSESLKKIIKQNLNGVSKISSDRQLDELKKLVLSKGFVKLSKDKFCKEVIILLFPQLINLDIFKNINDLSKKIIEKKDFIFLISLMIIDDTDNSEYFIYKYNISNQDKKRIRFLSNIYSRNLDKNIFKEKNLWKIFYYEGKDYLIDLIDFKIFQSKKSDKNLFKLKNFFNNQESPKFEIKAKTLIEKFNYKEGKELGKKLKEIEEFWIENLFEISDEQLKKIIKS